MVNVKEFNNNVQNFFEYCRKGNIEKVNFWIQSKTKKSKSPLNFLRPTTPCIGWLSCLREPSTSYTVLHQASLHGHSEIAQILIDQDHDLVLARDRRGCLPLHLAAWKGHDLIVKYLLVIDPSLANAVNNAKEGSLHLAAMNAHQNVIKTLVQNHANPKVRNARFETPLDIAARIGSAKICKILLLYSPNFASNCAYEINTASTHCSMPSKIAYPLHLAACYGNTECINVLCDNGFDINFVTSEGTALHVAAMFGHLEAVKLLIKRGANLNICDEDGKTVLERLKLLEEKKNLNMPNSTKNVQGWSECYNYIENLLNRTDPNLNENLQFKSETERQTVVWRVALENSSSINEHKPLNSYLPLSNTQIKKTPSFKVNGLDIKTNNVNSTSSIRPAFPKTSASHFLPSSKPNFSFQNEYYPLNNIQNEQPIYKNLNQQRNSISQENVSNNLSKFSTPPQNRKCNHNCCSQIKEDDVQYNHYYCNYHYYQQQQQHQPATVSMCDSRHFNHTLNFLHNNNSNNNKHTSNNMEKNTTLPVKSEMLVRPSVIGYFENNEKNYCTEYNQKINNNENLCASAFSTLERVENYDDVDTSAPIALPEELEGSMCISNYSSPDRFPVENNFSNKKKSRSSKSNGKTDALSSTSTLSSSFDPCDSNISCSVNYKPKNNSVKGKSLKSFYNQNNDSGVKTSSNSSNTSSLIRLNLRPSVSPTITGSIKSDVDKICLLNNDDDFRNLIVNGKVVDSNTTNHQNLSSRLSALETSVELTSNDNNSIALYKKSKAKEIDLSIYPLSMNHSDEWKKIDEILSSIQRGSFFDIDTTNESTNDKETSPPLTLNLSNTVVTSDYSTPTTQLVTKNQIKPILISWLHLNIGLEYETSTKVASILEINGFDSIHFLKGSLNELYMTELGINKNIRDRIMIFLNNTTNEAIRNIDDFEYSSDWLDALGLIDYLGSFANVNLTYTSDIIAARLTRSDLEKMGIFSLGHISRISRSLELALMKSCITNNLQNNKSGKTSLLDLLSGHPFPPPPPLPEKNNATNEIINSENNFNSLNNCDIYALDEAQRRQLLLDECISFSAHYLGSMEISNVEGAEDCRRAMTASKKRIKQVNKVPQVILEISVDGINVLDSTTNQLTVQHEIHRIQVVCQDELDLNCFAYIFQDGEKNFCHVYCVLTAGVAKDIIITLGEAFNLAFSLLN